MIDIETFNQLKPVFKQVLNGSVLGEGKEPKENIPFKVKINTISPFSINPDNNEEGQSSPDGEAVPVVNVVPLKGVMFKNDQECGPKGTRTIGQRLLNADADPQVLGHIMVIDSPGGTVEAAEELLPVFGQLTKPVIGFIDGMMCSAAFYVGSNCNEIIAKMPTYKVGSIGTMANFWGRKSKSEANMLGEVEVSIYADASTGKNAEYHKALDDFDFKPVKETLNKLNDRFTTTIKANRPGAKDDQLHGDVYEAAEVVGSLIDSIGSFDDAVQKVVELSKLNKGTAPTEENNLKILNKVTMKQFNAINAALGVDQLEGDEQGVYLNEEQLGAVETALNAKATALEAKEKELAESAVALKAAQDTAAAAVVDKEAAVAASDASAQEVASTLAAMDSIGPTVASAADATAKVAAVKAIVAAKISQSPTGALKGDPAPVEESDGWSESQKGMVGNL